MQGYIVNVNCPVYGYKIHAIIKLNLNAQMQEQLMRYIQEGGFHILHFYQTTGALAYVLDIYFLDDDEMQAFLMHIQKYGIYEIQLVLQDVSLE